MTNALPEQEGLADDIVDVAGYVAPEPTEKKFLAWHRPRKQYVRHHQWCREISSMVGVSPPSDGVLKYLGLPGVDLLDLRYFHSEVCEMHDVQLRFLGLNSGIQKNSPAHTELNISLDEVKRLPRVDPRSSVIGDDFARLANRKSIAFRNATELGPYDVINLDLCDGFGAQPPGKLNDDYYCAVNNLFALQARTKNPWLLLLTTRADKANIDDEVLALLQQKYAQNLGEHVQFRDASRELFSVETEGQLIEALDTPAGLLSIFLTGLCKWFVGLALAYRPPMSVEICSVIGYRVVSTAEHEDIISLAIKFNPTLTPVVDPLRLASMRAAVAPNEGALATRALRRVARRIDADRKMRDDENLRNQMTDATANLLALARYDPGAYRAWVNEE